ncbi:dihydrofolate reductase [Fibrobacteria bacterium R8-3-H12]
MLISLIAAVASNGVIGKDNKLPWHLPADLQFFKKTTFNHPIIMGRKNFESIGKALPGRTNIVLTRNPNFAAEGIIEGIIKAFSLKESFDLAQKTGAEECFVIGGSEVYKESLPFCQKLYITRVHGIFEGDAFMPEFENEFRRVSCETHFKDEKNKWDWDFEMYTR